MAIVLTLSDPKINRSLQIGDSIYYVKTTTEGEFQVNSSDIRLIGKVSAIGSSSITVNEELEDGEEVIIPDNSFLLFSKDNTVNSNGVLGYYAEVTFTNNSVTDAELWSVGVEIFESSK